MSIHYDNNDDGQTKTHLLFSNSTQIINCNEGTYSPSQVYDQLLQRALHFRCCRGEVHKVHFHFFRGVQYHSWKFKLWAGRGIILQINLTKNSDTNYHLQYSLQSWVRQFQPTLQSNPAERWTRQVVPGRLSSWLQCWELMKWQWKHHLRQPLWCYVPHCLMQYRERKQWSQLN